MRIGIVFHKDPFVEPTGIDIVRLRALARGFIERGFQAEIISPVNREGIIDGLIPVHSLDALDESSRYDVIKTSYHYSIELVRDYKGPVLSRIVRVVDNELPERDSASRERLLNCQQLIAGRASLLVLNNAENRDRWRKIYGNRPRIALIPTGCPEDIPEPGKNPYSTDRPVILFLGSIAAPRMVRIMNEAARRLSDLCEIHLVGLNKACMYGGDDGCILNSSIVDHGERTEKEIWDYIRHASVGLALATGPHRFDNDVSKIVNYLRGGLPVLSEEPIINNTLVSNTGLGATFEFDNVRDLASKAKELILTDFSRQRAQVMEYMSREHSWGKRAEAYIELFKSLV